MKRVLEGTDDSANSRMRLLMNGKDIGQVIGKGGANVKSIREQSGCHVYISDCPPINGATRMISLQGAEAAICRAAELLFSIDSDPQHAENGSAEKKIMCLLSNNEAGRVIGKGGAAIKKIREDSGISVQMQKEAVMGDDRVVALTGHTAGVAAAIVAIVRIVAGMPPDRDVAKRQQLSVSEHAWSPYASPFAQPPQAMFTQPYGQSTFAPIASPGFPTAAAPDFGGRYRSTYSSRRSPRCRRAPFFLTLVGTMHRRL